MLHRAAGCGRDPPLSVLAEAFPKRDSSFPEKRLGAYEITCPRLAGFQEIGHLHSILYGSGLMKAVLYSAFKPISRTGQDVKVQSILDWYSSEQKTLFVNDSSRIWPPKAPCSTTAINRKTKTHGSSLTPSTAQSLVTWHELLHCRQAVSPLLLKRDDQIPGQRNLALRSVCPPYPILHQRLCGSIAASSESRRQVVRP